MSDKADTAKQVEPGLSCGHAEAGYNAFGWGCQPCGVSASFPTVSTGPGWQDYKPKERPAEYWGDAEPLTREDLEKWRDAVADMGR